MKVLRLAWLLVVKPWGCSVTPCTFLHLLVPSPHLHWFWPPILQVCIWECLQDSVSVTAPCTLDCHPGKWFSCQWGFPCGSTGTASSNHVLFVWYHLECGELTLHRCVADRNCMWICHKLSPVAILREPKSPNIKCSGMESWL